MSILDTQPQPKTVTQAKVKFELVNQIKNLYRNMLVVYTNGYNTVWENSLGLTPAEALEALGTDAKEVFTLATILKNAINMVKPGTITTVAPDVVVNDNGTVTLAPDSPQTAVVG